MIFFFFESRALYEAVLKDIVQRGRSRMTMWPMRIACCKTKAVGTHSEFAILTDFPLQNYDRTKAPRTLRYTYIVSLCVCVCVCVCVCMKLHAEQN
jgi:hypothetical protein